MSLLSALKAAVASPPRRPAPPPLTGFQIGLIRAAWRGRLLLDARQVVAVLVTDTEGPVNVSGDVAVLIAGRYVRHDPVDFDLPPELRPPYVQYHPTPRGEDVLAAAAQRKKGGRK